jgi:hypothetical protein
MTVIWVAEDIRKDGSFTQTKAELMCTISCVLFIKQYYPNFKRVFFVDNFTKEYYNRLGVLDLFDEVNDTLLNESINIDKDIFWAASKILAQRITSGPTITFDLDFRIYDDISKFGAFDGDVGCLWLEETNNEFYGSPENLLKYPRLNWDFNWGANALNVSFLYLKNEEFKNLYCDYALEFMKYSYNRIPKNLDRVQNNKFILFIEQYMLYQLSLEHNQTVKLLIDDFYPIMDNNVKSCGITMNTCGNYFYHFGDHKKTMITDKDFYNNEINRCYEITNQRINNKDDLDIFNKIHILKEN